MSIPISSVSSSTSSSSSARAPSSKTPLQISLKKELKDLAKELLEASSNQGGSFELFQRFQPKLMNLYNTLSVINLQEKSRKKYLTLLIQTIFESKVLSSSPQRTHKLIDFSEKNRATLHEVETPFFFNTPQELLWVAILHADIEKARLALEKGADVNLPLHPGLTPLRFACRKGNVDMTRFLLEHGANGQSIGGTHDHGSPITELGYYGIQIDQIFSPDDIAFSREFEDRKLLAHLFPSKNLNGMKSQIGDQTFYVEGSRPRFFLSRLTAYRPFFAQLQEEILNGKGKNYEALTTQLSDAEKTQLHLNPSLRALMAQSLNELLDCFEMCLDKEISERTLTTRQIQTEAFKRLDNGLPIITFQVTGITESWSNGAPGLHGWGLVITKDTSSQNELYLVQRCNRGIGCGKHPGILSKLMNHQEILTLLLAFDSASRWKEGLINNEIHYCPFAQREIEDAILSPSDQIKDRYFPMDSQVNGNCCFSSLEAILIACLRAPLISSMGMPRATLIGKAMTDLITKQLQTDTLNSYLEKHFGSEPSAFGCDLALLSHVISSALPSGIINESFIPKLISALEDEVNRQPLDLSTLTHPEKIIRFYMNQETRYRTLLQSTPKKSESELNILKLNSLLNQIKQTDCLSRTPKDCEELSNFDLSSELARDTVESNSTLIAYLQSLKEETWPHSPAENTLAALFWTLFSSQDPSICEQAFILQFAKLSPHDQQEIQSQLDSLNGGSIDPSNADFNLLFLGTYNSILSIYNQASSEKKEKVFQSITQMKARSLEIGSKAMPLVYQELLPLYHSTTLHDEAIPGSLILTVLQDLLPKNNVDPSFTDSHFSTSQLPFYKQISCDPFYFLTEEISTGQRHRFQESMVKRNPFRLALALETPSETSSSSSHI